MKKQTIKKVKINNKGNNDIYDFAMPFGFPCIPTSKSVEIEIVTNEYTVSNGMIFNSKGKPFNGKIITISEVE